MKLDPDGVIGQRTWVALRSRGRPAGPSPAGFDPFDMRTLEAFFEALRQQIGTACAFLGEARGRIREGAGVRMFGKSDLTGGGYTSLYCWRSNSAESIL
jgi:hypothetical protein